MFIYLTLEGQEYVAKGQAPMAWHYVVYTTKPVYELPHCLLGEVTIPLPSRESCIKPVLAYLNEREKAIHDEAHAELGKLKSRRESLLALEMSGVINN